MSRPKLSVKALMLLVAIAAATVVILRPYLDPSLTHRLARQLDRGDAQARRAAAAELIWAEPDALALAADALIRGLADPDADVRAEAARTLGAVYPLQAGPRARAFINDNVPKPDPAFLRRIALALTAALADVAPTVRTRAAESLGRLDALPAAAVAPLRRILGVDPDPGARVASARALLRKPTDADWATIAALIASMRADPDPGVRLTSMDALVPIIDYEPVCNAFIDLMARDEGPDGLRALARVRLVQAPRASAVDGLRAALRRADLDESSTVVVGRLLRKIGPTASAAAPELLNAYRRADREALRRVGGDRSTAEVPARLIQVLWAVAPDSAEFQAMLTELIEILGVLPASVRQYHVAYILGTLGRAAAPALPALRKVEAEWNYADLGGAHRSIFAIELGMEDLYP